MDTDSNLTFRIATADDAPRLRRLWSAHTEWGVLDDETWRNWYERTPYGRCIIAVAIQDSGDAGAQLVFTPSRVRIGDRDRRALRISSVIVDDRHSSGRLLDMNHPSVGLLLTGIQAATAEGYELLYSLPTETGVLGLRALARSGLATFELGRFPCLAASLEDVGPSTLNGPLVQTVPGPREEHVALAQAAVGGLGTTCRVVRTRHWMEWRHGDEMMLEIHDRANADLLGFLFVRPRDGLITELVSYPEERTGEVLRAALEHVRGQKSISGSKLLELRAMAIPALAPILRDAGFEPVDFSFGFAATSLTGELANAQLAPERWYIVPGD